MSSSFDKFQKRRLISSYFSVVLSISLVLFLLGILGLFIVNSKRLADNFKEKIAMTVFFKNEANDTILKGFGTELKKAAYAKSSKKFGMNFFIVIYQINSIMCSRCLTPVSC